MIADGTLCRPGIGLVPMKGVDSRSRRCHAFSQSRLDVEEARLSAFGSGQLANDEVTPSPGAAGYLIRFNADVVPAEEALLAIVVVHSSKIEPRLQPMTTRSRGACTISRPAVHFNLGMAGGRAPW